MHVRVIDSDYMEVIAISVSAIWTFEMGECTVQLPLLPFVIPGHTNHPRFGDF